MTTHNPNTGGTADTSNTTNTTTQNSGASPHLSVPNARVKAARSRNNSPTRADAVERWERELEAARLRRAGLTWDAIARQLGYSDASHAHHRFVAFMKQYPKEDVDAARQLELDRLDRLQQALWAQCLDESSSKQHWAVDRVLKISDQRARLLGINAPVRQEISVLSESTVDRAIRELKEQLDRQAREVGAPEVAG